jgi:hypothetical protein
VLKLKFKYAQVISNMFRNLSKKAKAKFFIVIDNNNNNKNNNNIDVSIA